MGDLTTELQALTAELESAQTESIRLQAKISGLRAQRDSLAAALATQSASSGGVEQPLRLETIKKRTEAIVAILHHAARPLTIDEVRDALNEQWTDESPYQVVASTLNLLNRTGRISKVARGQYVAV